MNLPFVHLPGVAQWTSVGDCFSVTRKPRGLKLTSYSRIPFVSMRAIPNDGTYSPTIVSRIPAAIASGRYFERDDVLVARITPSFENGKQCIALNLPAVFGMATTEIVPLRPRDSTHDRRFLFYYLLHPTVRQHIAGLMEGTTGRQRVPLQVLLDLSYPVVSLRDQHAICNVLEMLQSMKAIDRRAEQVTQALRTRLYHALFRHGLGTDQPKDDVVGQLPETWYTDKLGAHFDIAQGCSVQRNLASGGDGIPFLRTSNVRWGHIDCSTISRMHVADASVPKLEDGDLLVCEGGEVGRAALWSDQIDNCTYQNHIHRLRANATNAVDSRFLARWLEEGFRYRTVYEGASNRTTIPNLSRSRLANLTIPVAPADVQDQLVRILDAVDQKIFWHKKRQEVTGELFVSVLHAFLAGELGVEDLGLEDRGQSSKIVVEDSRAMAYSGSLQGRVLDDR